MRDIILWSALLVVVASCGSSQEPTETRTHTVVVTQQPDDYSETAVMVESVVDVDVTVGRVEAFSDVRDNPQTERDLRLLMVRHAGQIVADCFQVVEEAGAIEGPEEGERLTGELIVTGHCRFGRCWVDGWLNRTRNREAEACLGPALEDFLSGRPELVGAVHFRVPMRVRLTGLGPPD